MTNLSIEEALGSLTDVFWWNYNAYTERKEADPLDKIVLINQGSTSSSKTFSVIQLLGFLAATDPEPKVTTIVGQDMPNLRTGAMRDLDRVIGISPFLRANLLPGAEGKNKANSTWKFKSGSIIEFKSYENSQDAQSGKRDRLFVNEANGVALDIYTELHDRTSELTILDFNPTSRFWAFKLYEGDPKATWILSNFSHNRYAAKGIVKSLLEYKTKNPGRWQVFGRGLLGKSEHNIYKNWKVVAEEFPDQGKLYGKGLDFGFGNSPTSCVRCCVYDGALYVQVIVHKKALKDSTLSDMLYSYDHWDETIVADSASPMSIKALQDEDLEVVAVKKTPNSIEEGIKILQEWEIRVIKQGSEPLVHELENYVYKIGSDGELAKPIDKYNHLMDALRYYGLHFLTQAELEEYEDPGVVYLN